MASVSRKDIINFLVYSLGASSYVLLDEFETMRARHVCPGTTQIRLLEKRQYPVVLPNNIEQITVDYFMCDQCKKLFLDKDSVTVVSGSPRVMRVNPNGPWEMRGMADPDLARRQEQSRWMAQQQMLNQQFVGNANYSYNPQGRIQHTLLGPEDMNGVYGTIPGRSGGFGNGYDNGFNGGLGNGFDGMIDDGTMLEMQGYQDDILIPQYDEYGNLIGYTDKFGNWK